MANDITRYERPAITADCVAFAVLPKGGAEGSGNLGLHVRLVRRNREPEEGKWALPGAFVPIDERIEDVMRDAAARKAGLGHPFYAEQLETFDTPSRDERWRVVSVAYLGIYPMAATALASAEEAHWFFVDQQGRTLVQPQLSITVPFDELAFDHAQILDKAVARLVAKSSYSDIALRLLGDRFTIAEIKGVMEAITEHPFNNVKRAFDSVIEQIEAAPAPDAKKPAHRPAAYYRRRGFGSDTRYKRTNQPKKGLSKMTDNDFSKHLIVIDMQNDFLTGALANVEAQAVLPNVIAKVEGARRAGDIQISWTRDTHGEDYMETQEGEKLPVPHCIKGTWGHELADGLAVAEGEGEFWKGTFGSWNMADDIKRAIEQKWLEGGMEDGAPTPKGKNVEIEIVGVCTDICVISNAMVLKAALPEARIVVDASCCAGVTPESHKCALDAMRACQIEIVNDEVATIASVTGAESTD